MKASKKISASGTSENERNQRIIAKKINGAPKKLVTRASRHSGSTKEEKTKEARNMAARSSAKYLAGDGGMARAA